MKHPVLTPCCAAFLLLATLFCAPAWTLEMQWGLGEHEKGLDPTHENLNWGFRDIAWGTAKSDVEEKHTLNQCSTIGIDVENCNVADANLSLGDIPLKHVRYLFHDDKFYGVSLKYSSIYEQDVLHKIVNLLGDPTGEVNSFPAWNFPSISVWASDTHFSLRSKKTRDESSSPDSGGTF